MSSDSTTAIVSGQLCMPHQGCCLDRGLKLWREDEVEFACVLGPTGWDIGFDVIHRVLQNAFEVQQLTYQKMPAHDVATRCYDMSARIHFTAISQVLSNAPYVYGALRAVGTVSRGDNRCESLLLTPTSEISRWMTSCTIPRL